VPASASASASAEEEREGEEGEEGEGEEGGEEEGEGEEGEGCVSHCVMGRGQACPHAPVSCARSLLKPPGLRENLLICSLLERERSVQLLDRAPARSAARDMARRRLMLSAPAQPPTPASLAYAR
jgi:hypothetical protein